MENQFHSSSEDTHWHMNYVWEVKMKLFHPVLKRSIIFGIKILLMNFNLNWKVDSAIWDVLGQFINDVTLGRRILLRYPIVG